MNNNLMFFNYLLENFSTDDKSNQILQLVDSIKLRNTYISHLKNDSLYNSIMNSWLNKTILKRTPKDTVSINELLNIAVKYFAVTKIDKVGNIRGKVCGGINFIKQTEVIRKPFLEAFAFSSIFKHYESDEYNMRPLHGKWQ
jgi:hypothetical protein